MPTAQELEIISLRNQIAKLEADKAKSSRIWCKIGEKGGISVYGINVQFPVTLYFEQWERLLDAAEIIRGFIKANRSKLKTKAEVKEAAEAAKADAAA